MNAASKIFRRLNHKNLVLKRSLALVVAIMLFFSIAGVAIASGGGEGPKGWVATDTYRVINFVILVIILFFVLRKPVAQTLSGRVDGIKAQLDELENKKKLAEKALANYKAKLSQLDKEAEDLVEQYVKQGREAKERILKEAENAATKLEEHARRSIEHEFKQAKLKLQEDILEKALGKAEEIIQSKITADDQNRLVDEYLEKVVA